jgi:hypothetical protein
MLQYLTESPHRPGSSFFVFFVVAVPGVLCGGVFFTSFRLFSFIRPPFKLVYLINSHQVST